jgi:MFS family permease
VPGALAGSTGRLPPVSQPSSILVRNPDFVRLWTADTISQFGTQVSLIAIPLIGAVVLKVPADQFALLGFFEFLPFILISLPAGVWVDRLRRRPILISGDLIRAASLLTIPIAYQLNALSIWQLYLVGFVNGMATVFFDVAYQSYLPSLVERDQIVEGNSKLEISRSAAQIAGPGIGGVLVAAVTAPIAVIADAVSFVVSAIAVFFIRRAEPPVVPHPEGERPSMVGEARAGLRYVLSNRYLRMIAGATGTSNLFGNILYSILILYMVNVLLMAPEQIGLVFSIGSIGPLVGAFAANRIARVIGVGPTIVASIFLSGPSTLLVALAPPSQAAIPFLIASGVVGGFGSMVYNINQVSFRQAITPPRMQGRMNATMRFIVWGTIPIGQILGGQIAARTSLSTAIWVGAIGSFLAFLFVLFSPVRSLRVMPEPAGDD